MKKFQFEDGQALILIVFGILALFGATALAVDGGNAYADRRKAQNAADAAALAGALARIQGQNWIQVVLSSAAQNGYNNDGTNNAVAIFSPPISGPNKGDPEYVQVQIISHIKTYFASVIGIPEITNTVEAVAHNKPPTYEPMVGGAAVVALALSNNCDVAPAFWVWQEASLVITGGGVFVNSNNPTCAFKEMGSGSIRIRDEHTIQIVGGADIQKPKLLTPYPPQTGAAPIPYPPPFFMPDVGCGGKVSQLMPDGHTITSGNWDNGTFPPPDVQIINLESGIYCLNADFIVAGNQQISGTGVVFKIEHGRVLFAGSAQLNLKAPQSGKLAGLLIYQPADNQNYLAINGNDFSTFMGSILAPGAEIRIKGNSSTYGFHSQIIGLTINVQGDSGVVIKYIPDENYQALSMPEIQFTK